MPPLADFMESLTQEQDKLVQMGTIKSSKHQPFSVGVSNQAKWNKKDKDSKQQRVKEKKHSDVERSSSTDEDSKAKRMKSKTKNTKCDYSIF